MKNNTIGWPTHDADWGLLCSQAASSGVVFFFYCGSFSQVQAGLRDTVPCEPVNGSGENTYFSFSFLLFLTTIVSS